MAKKRKSEANRLDEVERSMHSSFCSAANSLSQIYTQAMNQQKLSVQAGERHALVEAPAQYGQLLSHSVIEEKLYQWILRQHEESSRVTVADIVAYLQHELDCGGEDVSMSPRYQATSGSLGFASRSSQVDQTKNLVFSNALSSPIRRTIQSYHLSQGGENYPDNVLNTGNESRKPETHSNDSSMDMHSESPAHDSY